MQSAPLHAVLPGDYEQEEDGQEPGQDQPGPPGRPPGHGQHLQAGGQETAGGQQLCQGQGVPGEAPQSGSEVELDVQPGAGHGGQVEG